MSRVIVDLKAFALQYMRNPFGASFSIGFPLLLLVTFGAMFSPPDPPDVHLVIQDLDGTALSVEFIETLNQTAANQSGIFMTYMATPEDEVNEDTIREWELTGVLVIPAGFEAAWNMTSVDLILHADKSDSTYDVMVGAVEKATETFERDLSAPDQGIGIKTKDTDVDQFIFIDFFLPGIIALSIMLNCLMILSSLAADYWAKGYFKLLKTTPLRKWEWILSKLIWYVIMCWGPRRPLRLSPSLSYWPGSSSSRPWA